MEFHEAANIFPMDEETIPQLAEDISRHGLQVPIERFDGKIIDGRRRWLACEKAGVKPKIRDVTVADPVAYVLSLNLHRRHLSPTQLSMVGGRARKWYDEQAKERQKRKPTDFVPANLPEQKTDARDAVGMAVGVSGKSIDHATKVLKHGTPKLIAAVDANQISVSTASRASTNSKADQDALAERAAESAARGHRLRPRPTDDHEPEEKSNGEIKAKGVGVIRAHEAINCLTRIPKNDALRKRGFQIVTDWIRHNK